MWVMTTRGFYSAVQDRDNPARVIVRARCEADIRALKDLLPDAKPVQLRDSDYEWRLSCTAVEWAAALMELALEIDYPNFKNAIKAHQGPKRASIYMRIWTALLSIERRDRFSKPQGRARANRWRKATPLR